MRALIVTELGSPPRPAERRDPAAKPGEVLVRLEAASLNPVDIAIAGGSFYSGHPDLPYVPCIEGVGRVVGTDTRVFAMGGGLGLNRDGTASEIFAAPESALIELSEDVDAGVAAALGTAALAGWLPLTWRAPVSAGDTVIVLGATGTAGRVALQTARLRGAAKVIGVGRTGERLETITDLADVTVTIAGDDFPDRLRDAVGQGADIIFDALWGEPLVTSLGVAKPGARVVHVGQSAGPVATIPSGLVRGRQAEILGYSNFTVPRDVLEKAYTTLVALAAAGSLRMDVTATPFAEIETAWQGVAASRGKFVVVT